MVQDTEHRAEITCLNLHWDSSAVDRVTCNNADTIPRETIFQTICSSCFVPG